jgi:predicted DNA-binding WGR domain protein
VRTCQFSAARSHKFWNIDAQGKSLTGTKPTRGDYENRRYLCEGDIE